MAVISDITKTVCLKLYHSNDFSDLEKYVSAIYYAEDGRFIWEVSEQERYKLFITESNDCLAEQEIDKLIVDVIGSVGEYYYSYEYFLIHLDKLDDSKKIEEFKEDVIVIKSIDCTGSSVIEEIQEVLNNLKGVCSFICLYNLHNATNDTLLWLADWMRDAEDNFIITVEAAWSGTHDIILGLD